MSYHGSCNKLALHQLVEHSNIECKYEILFSSFRGVVLTNCDGQTDRTKTMSPHQSGGHFKYLYLCGGTPKIIKILVVVPQIIDGVPIQSPETY